LEREFTFEELWRVLIAFRKAEGFLKSDVELFQDAFQRFEKDGRGRDGEISTLELGKVLRWLGHASNLDQQQALLAKIDVDGSGLLDIGEFLKLMRQKQEEEIQYFRKTFKLNDMDQSGTLSAAELLSVLRGAGYAPTLMAMKKACQQAGFAGKDVNFDEFLQVMRFYRQAHVERMRAEKKRLQRLLKAADPDGDGELDFNDFLRLMREYHDEMDERALLAELEAVRASGFSREEVEEFRMVFAKFDLDKSGELNPKETKLLFEQFTRISAHQLDELVQKVDHEVAFDETTWLVRFPSFLMMMRMVLDHEVEGVVVHGEEPPAPKKNA